MAKDKKKKAKDKGDKKGKKKGRDAAPAAGRRSIAKAAKGLKAVADNPLAADIVAAALVATAAALRDSNKARQLAAQAGSELNELAKSGSKRGEALWQLALDVGRRALEELSGNDRRRSPRKPVK